VAYLLELHEVAVAPYLESLPLSPEGQEALLNILEELRTHADKFRADPALRLGPGSDCFEVRWLFRDRGFDRYHALRLVISDATAAYGVLRVVYAEDDEST
jgi:hypothetical protein